MSEQPDPMRVMFYCDRCRRRSGHHRPLAEALQEPGGTWSVGVILRRGRRAVAGPMGPAPPLGIQQRQGTLHPGSRPTSSGMRRDAGSRSVKLIVQPGRAAQLICPASECTNKPREAWEVLVNQARETVAAGRSHTYV